MQAVWLVFELFASIAAYFCIEPDRTRSKRDQDRESRGYERIQNICRGVTLESLTGDSSLSTCILLNFEDKFWLQELLEPNKPNMRLPERGLSFHNAIFFDVMSKCFTRSNMWSSEARGRELSLLLISCCLFQYHTSNSGKPRFHYMPARIMYTMHDLQGMWMKRF